MRLLSELIWLFKDVFSVLFYIGSFADGACELLFFFLVIQVMTRMKI